MSEKVEQIPVIRISTQRSFDNGATLIMETYAAQDAPKEKLDELMDKLTDVSDRQNLHASLAREEQLLYNANAELERMTEGLKKCDERSASLAQQHQLSGRRGDFKLPETEAKAREGLITNVQLLAQKRDQTAERIAELKRALGKLPLAAE